MVNTAVPTSAQERHAAALATPTGPTYSVADVQALAKSTGQSVDSIIKQVNAKGGRVQ